MKNYSEKTNHNLIAEEHYKIVLKILTSFPKGTKVLDVGSGEGILSEKLREAGLNVYACDIDRNAGRNGVVHFKFADLNKKIPFDNVFFDIAVCLEVIEHIRNPWLLIDEIYRVLKADGIVILSSPNTSNCVARIYHLATGKIVLFKDFTSDHINPISYWETQRIMRESGFRKCQLVDGVSVIKNVSMVTKLSNPILKVAYNLIFNFLDLCHELIKGRDRRSRILFKSFSYIVKAKK